LLDFVQDGADREASRKIDHQGAPGESVTGASLDQTRESVARHGAEGAAEPHEKEVHRFKLWRKSMARMTNQAEAKITGSRSPVTKAAANQSAADVPMTNVVENAGPADLGRCGRALTGMRTGS